MINDFTCSEGRELSLVSWGWHWRDSGDLRTGGWWGGRVLRNHHPPSLRPDSHSPTLPSCPSGNQNHAYRAQGPLQLEAITPSSKGRPFTLPALVQQSTLETNAQQDGGQPSCALHPQVTGSLSTARTKGKRGSHWTMDLIEGGGGGVAATLRSEVVSPIVSYR